MPCAGDFETIKVKPRSFYVARLIWEGAQDDARQEMCMRLVAGMVSQWIVWKGCGRPKLKFMRFTA